MPNEPPPSQLQERNPFTYKVHRQQVFWQILIPIVFSVVLVLIFAVLATRAGSNEASRWADISLILLASFLIVISLVALVVLIFSIYGLRQALRGIPAPMLRVQVFFFRVERRVRAVSNQIVEPFLRYHTSLAGLRSLRRD